MLMMLMRRKLLTWLAKLPCLTNKSKFKRIFILKSKLSACLWTTFFLQTKQLKNKLISLHKWLRIHGRVDWFLLLVVLPALPVVNLVFFFKSWIQAALNEETCCFSYHPRNIALKQLFNSISIPVFALVFWLKKFKCFFVLATTLIVGAIFDRVKELRVGGGGLGPIKYWKNYRD